MEATGSSTAIPCLRLQSPSVDFIDNHLPHYHEAFNNSLARYDKTLDRYVPASTAMATQTVQSRSEVDERIDQFQLTRPLLGSSVLMKFWDHIFSDSLQNLKSQYSEPIGRADSEYTIRNADDWEGVYSKLQLAREKYEWKEKGYTGGLKRFTRKVADQAGSAARLVKFIPEGTCTTPVKAVVEILLDAAKVASKVRMEVTKSFDGERLDQLFADIEVFLGTYPKDENIKKASVDLVVAILKAIEDAIGFFTKHSGNKALSAVKNGAKYQEPLIDSMDKVRSCSEVLQRQASNSEKVVSMVTLQNVVTMKMEQEVMREDFKASSGNIAATLDNIVKKLLDSYEKNCAMQCQIQKLREQESRLKLQNEQKDQVIRQLTPTPQTVPWAPPTVPAQASAPFLPTPFYQTQLPWLWASTSGAFVAGATDLRQVWAAQHSQHPYSLFQQPLLSSYDLLLLCAMSDIDNFDLDDIIEHRDLVSVRDRTRAEQVASTQQFRDWIVCPKSSELLVHGENEQSLSLLCAVLTRTLRSRARHVGLAFFCGRHSEEDDKIVGGNAVIRSLIVQLLRFRPFDAIQLGLEVNLNGVQSSDTGSLCVLFSWLVRRLPNDMTLIFLVDGIDHYDNDEHEQDMFIVLKCILGLARDNEVLSALKILATSSSTTEFKSAFKDDESSFLSMKCLPRTNQEAAMLRLNESDDEED